VWQWQQQLSETILLSRLCIRSKASKFTETDPGEGEGKLVWTGFFFQRQFQHLDAHRDSRMQQWIQKMQKCLLFTSSPLELIPLVQF
jgi:hypothetical protein